MSRLPRKQAQSVGDALKDFFRTCRLTPQLNTHRVFEAWNNASGASKYTSRLFFRSGVLYVTTTSSVVRSQLLFQKDALLEKMNMLLEKDDLFDRCDASTGAVTDLKIK